MSSPIHHAEDLDAALTYAPPWARQQATPSAGMRSRPPRMARSGHDRRAFSGDLAMVELQRQLALHPDGVPEPPAEDTQSLLPMVLRLGAVTAAAAVVAWGMVALTGTQKVSSESAQADTPPAAARLAGPNPVKLVHFAAPAIMPPLLPNQLAAPNLSPLPQQAAPPPAAAPQPAFVPPPRPALVLADDEIATLVKRGQDLLQNGDLASARLLLRRAAEAGNANAALALAASFDPLVIARLGVIGIQPDIARARQWYAKAAELGSTDASQQLAKLERER